jgi:hypothetical protein
VEKIEQLITEDENLKIAIDTICKKLNVWKGIFLLNKY